MQAKNNHINYIEFKAQDLERTKAFYSKCFNWSFKDFGDKYIAFSESGLFGGFEKTEDKVINGALVVLYHQNLDAIKEVIIKEGGTISIDTFSFPGGKRFHFIDTEGNELAVWTDK